MSPPPLLHLEVNPGVVAWKKVNIQPKNQFKKVENANYAVVLGKQLENSRYKFRRDLHHGDLGRSMPDGPFNDGNTDGRISVLKGSEGDAEAAETQPGTSQLLFYRCEAVRAA